MCDCESKRGTASHRISKNRAPVDAKRIENLRQVLRESVERISGRIIWSRGLPVARQVDSDDSIL